MKRKPKEEITPSTTTVERYDFEQELTPAEERFVFLVCDPTDPRSIGEKAQECGWKAASYGWQLMKTPHIAKAVAMLRQQVRAELEGDLQQVIYALKHRATNLKTLDARAANEASEILLRVGGRIDGQTASNTQVNIFAIVGANVIKSGGAAGARIGELPRELEVAQQEGSVEGNGSASKRHNEAA